MEISVPRDSPQVMRLLFCGQAVVGHVFPMLPLQHAAQVRGHTTAVMTGAELAVWLPDGVQLLPVGRPIAESIRESTLRPGGGVTGGLGPGAAELFAGVTVDFSFDEAVRQATAFRPDVMVCEPFDISGRLVAAEIEVPWVRHEISDALPGSFVAAVESRATAQFTRRSLSPRDPLAIIDPYPAVLRGAHVDSAPTLPRLSLRPTAHASYLPGAARGDVPSHDRTRPVVLVTLGTSLRPMRPGP